jgi:hypothetical protein
MPPKPDPRHLPTGRCGEGACWWCTPHAELRELLSAGDSLAWRHRLLVILVRAGLTTPAAIKAKTDAELLAVPGIGEANLACLRGALADGAAPAATDSGRLAALIEQAMHRKGGKRALP